MFEKGDKVQDIYSGDVFTVKKNHGWQDYAGSPSQTVEFYPAFSMGLWQPTPWNKGCNLRYFTHTEPFIWNW